MEEEQEKNYITSKIRELQDSTKGTRNKNKLEDNSPKSTTSILWL